MGFLKRLLGGGPKEGGEAGAEAGDEGVPAGSGDPGRDEIERDRALLRDEAMRLSDDLIQRQLRYASRSWTPPAQGGTRRSDDGEGTEE
jgi:hypothetical protein